MKVQFNRIALLGYPRNSNLFFIHQILYYWLIKKGYNVVIEHNIAKFLNLKNPIIDKLSNIGKICDLGIVIGGDGNMLCVLRALSYYPIKMIGINCGNLGFLTDLNPNNMIIMLSKILSGEYNLEKRFLLEVNVINHDVIHRSIAVNEIVLRSEKVSYMIEFEVYIDDKFAFYQRSDGLIISTPTGSTGYSLSAGGPILSNSSAVIVILPMLPHTLSSRPLVINNNDIIMLKINNFKKKMVIHCDGQVTLPLCNESRIVIFKSKNCIHLIHPLNYHYLDTLRTKLNWSKSLF